MENLYYNGINIIDLAKRRKPQIHSVVSGTEFQILIFFLGSVAYAFSTSAALFSAHVLMHQKFLLMCTGELKLDSKAWNDTGFLRQIQMQLFENDNISSSIQFLILVLLI